MLLWDLNIFMPMLAVRELNPITNPNSNPNRNPNPTHNPNPNPNPNPRPNPNLDPNHNPNPNPNPNSNPPTHAGTKLIIKERQTFSREIVFDLATSSDQPRSRIPHLEHRLIKKNDSLLLQVTIGSAASTQPYKISNVVLAITITSGILLCFLIMVLPYLRRIYIEDHALSQDDRSAVYVINKGMLIDSLR
ncbi:uncharacterized protein LOC115209614 [Argonauta hians]